MEQAFDFCREWFALYVRRGLLGLELSLCFAADYVYARRALLEGRGAAWIRTHLPEFTGASLLRCVVAIMLAALTPAPQAGDRGLPSEPSDESSIRDQMVTDFVWDLRCGLAAERRRLKSMMAEQQVRAVHAKLWLENLAVPAMLLESRVTLNSPRLGNFSEQMVRAGERKHKHVQRVVS